MKRAHQTGLEPRARPFFLRWSATLGLVLGLIPLLIKLAVFGGLIYLVKDDILCHNEILSKLDDLNFW